MPSSTSNTTDQAMSPYGFVLFTVFFSFLWAESEVPQPTLVGFGSQVIKPATNSLPVDGSNWSNLDRLGFGVCCELLTESAQIVWQSWSWKKRSYLGSPIPVCPRSFGACFEALQSNEASPRLTLIARCCVLKTFGFWKAFRLGEIVFG